MRLWTFLLIGLLLLGGCGGAATPEPPPDPNQLLTQATTNILGSETLQILLDRSGADYAIQTELGSAVINRLEAQYRAPETIRALARVMLGRLTTDIEVFARDEDQWWRVAGTPWQNIPFLPGFNPRALLQEEDRGLQAALRALKNVRYLGESTLEDGSTTYHLTSEADGAEVSWMLLYIVQITGRVTVDVFIDKALILPIKFVIVQPETATDQVGPTTWNIELFDFNEPLNLVDPSGAPTAAPG